VERICNEWPQIADAISRAVDLLVEYGFSGNTLTSQNATIIIAYYLYKGGKADSVSKDGIRKYLVHALLKGVYGTSQDSVLASFRNAFRKEVKDGDGRAMYDGAFQFFDFDATANIPLAQGKSLKVSEEDLDRFLDHTKGASAFHVLALLYPHLRYNDVSFHQDHMHPYAGFCRDAFDELGLDEEERRLWLGRRDRVPNLQLMNGKLNISKNKTPLTVWLGKMDDKRKDAFLTDNYFPDAIDTKFADFQEFYEARREKLKVELRKVLKISTVVELIDDEDIPLSRSETDEQDESVFS
jgi:hypothetical protein